MVAEMSRKIFINVDTEEIPIRPSPKLWHFEGDYVSFEAFIFQGRLQGAVQKRKTWTWVSLVRLLDPLKNWLENGEILKI